MAIFTNRIVVYNTDDENFPSVSAKYFGGRIKLTGVYQSRIKPDPEDLIVVNVPWDIIQMTYTDVPDVKSYKDVVKLAELEVRRLTDINEGINVGVLKCVAGKMLALYTRRSDYLRYKEVNNFDFEPDVAYPNILSELLLIKKLPGIWAYVVLGMKNSGIVLMENDNFVNLRIIELLVEDIDKIIVEETGFSLREVENSGSEDLINSAAKILSSIEDDIRTQIERELIITLNTAEFEKLTIQQLSGIVIVCDYKLIKNVFSNEASIFFGKLSDPVFVTRLNKKISLSTSALVYRGGMELGKVKSFNW
ncbi:MAG: hypothetical protein ACK4MM_00935 [Fervidobacterium sp.]